MELKKTADGKNEEFGLYFYSEKGAPLGALTGNDMCHLTFDEPASLRTWRALLTSRH